MDEFKNYGQSLIIFDDLVNTPSLHSGVIEYYIRGRKLGISMAYLSQSYFGIPPKVRQNADYIVLKKILSEKDLGRILREYDFGVGKKELSELQHTVTQNRQHWLMIDLINPDTRFRHNYSPISVQSTIETKGSSAAQQIINAMLYEC